MNIDADTRSKRKLRPDLALRWFNILCFNVKIIVKIVGDMVKKQVNFRICKVNYLCSLVADTFLRINTPLAHYLEKFDFLFQTQLWLGRLGSLPDIFLEVYMQCSNQCLNGIDRRFFPESGRDGQITNYSKCLSFWDRLDIII